MPRLEARVDGTETNMEVVKERMDEMRNPLGEMNRYMGSKMGR